VLVLSACGETKDADAEDKNPDEKKENVEKQNKQEKEGKKEKDTVDTETEIEQEIVKELSVEEVKQIINDNIEQRKEIKSQLFDEHYEHWYSQNWTRDREDEGAEFQAALLVARELLSSTMTEKALDDEAEDYTRASACECDWILDSELEASVRVEIESQSKDRFRATSLTLGEGLIPSVAHVWDYQKDGDTWKMDQHQSISPEEKPFDVTFDDLVDFHSNTEKIDFIEKTVHEGEEYIVILTESGSHRAFSVINGWYNHEVASKYDESDEKAEEDQTISDSEEKNEVAENDPEPSIFDELTPEDYKAMEHWGGDWDRIDNYGEGQGLITSRPPAIDVAITDNKSIVSGFIQVTSENGARFYDEESGCELELILKDEETIEVKEVTECSALKSSPEGIYEKNFNR